MEKAPYPQERVFLHAQSIQHIVSINRIPRKKQSSSAGTSHVEQYLKARSSHPAFPNLELTVQIGGQQRSSVYFTPGSGADPSLLKQRLQTAGSPHPSQPG